MNTFVTVLTLAAVFASSEAGPQGRITYGQIVGPRDYVFQVGLSELPGRNATIICGGVIISNYWVLTAAHCAYNLPNVTLHIGSTNFSNPALVLTVPANKITRHPGYNRRTKYNDIALINTTYIEFTPYINKVSLPSMSVDVGFNATNLIVNGVGWGTDENGLVDLHHLKKIPMRVLHDDVCEYYLYSRFNTDKSVCTVPEVGSVCQGDSGGPLVMASNKVLLGITSAAVSPTCAIGYPVIFVRVTEYLDWIKAVSGVFKP